MNNTCPECGTVYAVAPKDVGRRIACTKCGAVLAIGEGGFEKEKEADTSTVVERPLPRKPRFTPEFRERLRAMLDWPTAVFGLGAFLVLSMMFMPLVGKAKVERRTGLLQEEQFDHEAEIRKLREKPGNETKIVEAEEAWKKRRESLEAEIKHAEFANSRSGYTDRYGLLLGFILMMVGSLRLMRTGEGLVKRIFGAVVLGAQMLLVFNSLLGGCGRWPGA
jgi:predicted Zn finger-like uncharacterized protein